MKCFAYISFIMDIHIKQLIHNGYTDDGVITNKHAYFVTLNMKIYECTICSLKELRENITQK